MQKPNDKIRVQFKSLQLAALAAGVASISLNPSNTLLSQTRLPAIADSYAHFRLLKLSFRLHPRTSVNTDQAVGIVGGVQDTSPGTVAQVGELLSSTLLGADATVPSSWVHATPQELRGPLPWYKTVLGTADPTEEQPGAIVIAGSGTDVYALEIEGEVEFKVSVATGNTPDQIALRAALRRKREEAVRMAEREALLRVLAAPTSSTVSSKP